MKLLLSILGLFISLNAQNNLDESINKLCLQLSKEMLGEKKITVAVLEFSDLDGNTSEFGKFISEEIITQLYRTRRFTVIERHLLNSIIREQKLQQTGLFDDKSVRLLGKILGVSTVITGTVVELSTSARINARLISTETAEVYGTASCEIQINESLKKLFVENQISLNNKQQEMTINKNDSINSLLILSTKDSTVEERVQRLLLDNSIYDTIPNLKVFQTSNKPSVIPGDTTTIYIIIVNVGGDAAYNINIETSIQSGFEYQKNSMQINTSPFDSLPISDGNDNDEGFINDKNIVFNIKHLAKRSWVKASYRMIAN